MSDSRSERLKAAEALTDSVLNELDDRKSKCTGCGSNRYKNFDQHHAAVELQAIGKKLRKLVDEPGLED